MCTVMIFAAVPIYSSAEDIDITAPSVQDEECYEENHVLFLYTQTVADKSSFSSGSVISDELADCGITYLKEIKADSIYDTEIKTNADGTFTKSTFFNGTTSLDAESCLEKIKKLSSVSEASLNICMHEDSFSMPCEVANPTYYYNNYTKWWFEDSVHIPDAWQEHSTLGAGVTVAVIDSGVCVNNPEIADNIWVDENGNRGYNADSDSFDPSPISTHGSNVAGIVAGSVGNNTSLIGVAPEAQIMAIRVAKNPLQILVDSVIAGMNYAISNGADIITMSLSTKSNVSSVKNACDAAYRAGIIVISSAGNNTLNTTGTNGQKYYPAAYPTVIGVMAYDTDERLCDFSNYDTTHSYYDIAAPGRAILGLPSSNSITSLTAMSGTSQATPIVAGAAALYLSLYPDTTPAEFKDALMNSCTDTVKAHSSVSNTYTFKKLDAVKLLSYNDVIPELRAVAGTSAVIDSANGFIYGLEENYLSIDDYITVLDGDYEFIPTENGNGTGSILRVYFISGEIYKDYEVVIFGDTDGDAKCDGMDCALCQYALYGGEEILDSVRFACDVDFDDSITPSDLNIITMCGLKADFVSQIR